MNRLFMVLGLIIFVLFDLCLSGCNSEELAPSALSGGTQSCSSQGLEYIEQTSLPIGGQDCSDSSVTVEGTLEVLAALNIDGSESTEFVLETDEKARYSLFFQGQTPELQSGTRLRVEGHHLLCGLTTPPIPLVVDYYEMLEGQLDTQALSGVTGEQKTAVILVSFSDSPNTKTAADAQSIVFTKVSNFMLENSFNKTWLTGNTFGPYTIATTKAGCDSAAIADQALAAATNAGVDLAPYKRRVFVFPKNGCTWYGLGTIGGTTTKAWLNDSLTLFTTAHELGHNLGLYHSNAHNCGASTLGTSCSTIEYGDTTDVMGNKLAGHYNAFQKERLGWIDVPTVAASGTFTIQPYETSASTTKAVKILKSTSSTGAKTYYYLEFRQPVGFDAALAGSSTYNLTSGVVVHTGSTSTGNSSFLLNMNPSLGSWYKAALPAGQTFTDSTSGVSFSVGSTGAGGATVSVSIAGTTPTPTPSPTPTLAPCTRGTPSVTLAAAQSGALPAGSSAAYLVTVRNNDSETCGAQNFSLTAARPSTSWMANFTSSQLTALAPGASASTTLTLDSPTGASAGTYSFTITATPGTGTSKSATGSYVVAAPNVLAVSLPMENTAYSTGQAVVIPIEARLDGQLAVGGTYRLTVSTPDGQVVEKTGVLAASGLSAETFRVATCTKTGGYLASVNVSYNGKTATNTRSFLVQ